MKSKLIFIYSFLATVVLVQACSMNATEELSADQQTQSSLAVVSKPSHPVSQPVSQAEPSTAVGMAREEKQRLAVKRLSQSQLAPQALSRMDYQGQPLVSENREQYAAYENNAVRRVSEQPVSTFSIDVDTGSYANVRRFLQQGQLPNKHAVRVEEMINYFSYDYAQPESRKLPFSLTTEIAPSPWNQHSYLMHLGLKAYEVEEQDLPPANLVFLVDVSGSMQSANKLGLLKSGLKLLVKQMDKDDRISLVVYAGASGVVLEPTAGDQKAKILTALDGLQAGGSTNGGAGIQLAYQMAQQAFIKNGINRILLATDGDFNVGVSNFESLKQLVETERKNGVALTTLGFGTGNYNDHLMEQLADAGNGNYSYIDTLNEARKVLVEEISSTMHTVAKDVKIQIEFNPAVVAEYRLIGYENRVLKREDFTNDKVDAGDVGAGHSVTALYEISLAGSNGQRLPGLRYSQQNSQAVNADELADELATLSIRYKQPDASSSQLVERVIKKQSINEAEGTSDDFRFSAAIAAFGQLLRGGEYMEAFQYDDVLKLARQARGDDIYGYRGEFIQMVSLAKSLN